MNDSSDITTRTVRDWLSGDAAARVLEVADPARLRNVRARAHRNASTAFTSISEHPATSHYFLPGRDRSTPLCVKLVDVSHPDHAAFFRREVIMLRKLNRATKDSGANLAPRVLLADDHTGIIVMDWVQGRSVKLELMWRYALQRDTAPVLKDCGAWLRQFHQINGVSEQGAPAIEMMEMTELAIAEMPESAGSSLICSPVFLKAIEHLRSHASELDGLPVEWGLNHRDFTPSNLIRETSSGRILGIDFGYSVEMSPVAIDLASFILRTSDLTVTSLTAGSKIDRLFLALSGGYKPDAQPDELKWLNWCALHAAVMRMMRRRINLDERVNSGLVRKARPRLAMRLAIRAVARFHSHAAAGC